MPFSYIWFSLNLPVVCGEITTSCDPQMGGLLHDLIHRVRWMPLLRGCKYHPFPWLKRPSTFWMICYGRRDLIRGGHVNYWDLLGLFFPSFIRTWIKISPMITCVLKRPLEVLEVRQTNVHFNMFASIQKGKSGFFHIQIILYVGLARLFDHLKSTKEVYVSFQSLQAEDWRGRTRTALPLGEPEVKADIFPDNAC